VLEVGEDSARIAFPEHNVEGDIGTLLTMIFGKYSMAGAAKVVSVSLPDHYGTKPKFGISGIRDLLGVADRPLIMGIFKPALGLSPADHADILGEVVEAGIDVIKDDEILGSIPGCAAMQRLQACLPHLQRADRRVLYAVNVTGRAHTLLSRARELVQAGANALLVNVLTHGISVLEALAEDPEINVPILAHPAFAGALCGAPAHGLSYSVVLGTLLSHAGADAVLYPAHYGSLPFDPQEEANIRDALRSRGVFPVPSAGINPGIVPRALEDYGADVVLNAGSGIMDHPSGPGAGVRAFFEALEHHKAGGSFQAAVLPSGPLREALQKWPPKG